MAMASTAVTEAKPANALVVFNQQLEVRVPQFAAALPAHIPVERFKRVVLTAVQRNADLLGVSRTSFFNACMLAAQDGLLPDGREGAIVKYGTEAQWLPMVGGIRKKARNSGEISDLWAAVVHKNDLFKFQLGDKPFIHHEPVLEGDPGEVIAAYSICVLKDGTISRDVMRRRDIDKRRKMSKASRADSPWNVWFEEMCCKTVIKHHAKSLPTSTDLDDLIRRDDDLYDLKGDGEEAREEPRRPRLHALLDQVAQQPQPDTSSASEPDDEQETAPASDAAAGAADAGGLATPASNPSPAEPEGDPRKAEIMERLRAAALKGTRKLKLARGGLTVDEIALLTPGDDKALADAARIVDAKEGVE
jgi:recombination protein RecT